MKTIAMVCHSEIENEVNVLFHDKLNSSKMDLTSQVNSYLSEFLYWIVKYRHLILFMFSTKINDALTTV